jgi:DNA-binding SARP family transcriptional activator
VNLLEGLIALLHQPSPCCLTILMPDGSPQPRPGEGRRVEAIDVRLFGQLEVADGGVALAARGAKQRALLALLALHRGEPVSADRLIDVLWADGQAANPANALQAQIGQLRRTLGAGAIVTTEAGYALAVGPDEVDVVRFEQLVAKGRRLAEAGEMEQASAVLGEALDLRRGEPLAEFAYAGFADTERAQLDELTLVAIETRAGADLVLGRHGQFAGELEPLCLQHPLRERLWELLILALYRAGRQAEALRAYTEVRDRLVDELGIDPSPALRELQARILAQESSLATAAPAPVRAAAPAASGNLRERLSSFVGRDAELDQLREVVRASRLVTLTGPGGRARPAWRWRPPPPCAPSTKTAPGWSSWPASPGRPATSSRTSAADWTACPWPSNSRLRPRRSRSHLRRRPGPGRRDPRCAEPTGRQVPCHWPRHRW